MILTMKSPLARGVLYMTLGLLLMAWGATAVSAQVLYGSIVGTLTDETGAVVPGAVVTVKNTSTGLSRETTTRRDRTLRDSEPARRRVRPVCQR